MTLLIRADASPERGAGHVMRCLALAQAWMRQGAPVRLLAAEMIEPLASRLTEEGVEVRLLEGAAGSPSDAEATLAEALASGARWIVLDGYHFDLPFQRALRGGARLLVIDDFATRSGYAADLVLDQNLHSEPLYRGQVEPESLLAGPRWVLLREEFLHLRADRNFARQARRVVVLAGGTGSRAMASLVSRALRDLRELELDVRFQSGNLLPSPSDKVEGTVISDSRQIGPEIAAADLAVSAAGSTCWELAYLGCPSLLLSVADNQLRVAEALHRDGVMDYVGPVDSIEAERLSERLRALITDPKRREAMSRRGQEMIDGRGAQRVTQAMITLDGAP